MEDGQEDVRVVERSGDGCHPPFVSVAMTDDDDIDARVLEKRRCQSRDERPD